MIKALLVTVLSLFFLTSCGPKEEPAQLVSPQTAHFEENEKIETHANALNECDSVPKRVDAPIIHPIAWKTCTCSEGYEATCDQFNVAQCGENVAGCHCGMVPYAATKAGKWKCYAHPEVWAVEKGVYVGEANSYVSARVQARNDCINDGNSKCYIMPGACKMSP